MKCPQCDFENPADTKFCGNCAAPLKPLEETSFPFTKTLQTPKSELTTGSTFAGRYQVIEELGKGGMGTVYKVYDTEIKEKIALKLLNPEVAADEKTIERFRNELKLARKIGHRNVCRMYDLSKEKGTPYITMEYVAGENLKSMIGMMGQLSTGKAVVIADQICAGLGEAHRLGVVHRDLKPQNIMIDKEGNARIMDFGIARTVKGKGITGSGVMIGTPDYMSPEQAEVKDVDQRSDIYSLGVILYEMVTGKLPFEGETPLAVAMKHKSEIPQDPRKINAQIPEELSRVILRCLEKDKEKRYQNAREVRSEFEGIKKGIPTTERVIPRVRPGTSKEITVTFNLRKIIIPAAAAVVLIIVAVVIWQLLLQKEAIPPPSDKPSIAVMYFVNNTGDETLDHWRSALPEWLITDLTQSRYITVLSGDRLLNILRKLDLLNARSYDSEDLMRVAREGGVNHILKASYSKAGNTFRIDYSLQEISSGESIGSDYVTGIGEESFPAMVDELTRKVKSNLRLSEQKIASDIDAEVGTISSSSPEAFTYYIEGRESHNSGNFERSIELMKQAVEIDPGFAMAYRSLSVSYKNLGFDTEARQYLEKAFELAGRLSERERYLIQGDFYRDSEKTFGKAIEAFDKLLAIYPDDRIALNNSAIIFMNLEEFDKAGERFERAIRTKDPAIQPYQGLFGAKMALGRYDQAREVLQTYIDTVSDNPQVRLYLAWSYYVENKTDLSLAEGEKISELAPTVFFIYLVKGDGAALQGDMGTAEKEYQKLVSRENPMIVEAALDRLTVLYVLMGKYAESRNQIKKGIELAEKANQPTWKSLFHYYLIDNYLRTGSPERALELLDKEWRTALKSGDLDDQRYILHIRGLAYLKKGMIEEARKTAEELKNLIDQGMNKKIIRRYHHLRGMIEMERKNYSQAIQLFQKAVALLPFQYQPTDEHALYLDSLAFSYYQIGDLDKALEEYERITSLTSGRIEYGDLYAKSFFMLGKIYEQKGWKGKALENYERFLTLWKDADPGLPEIEDARKRAVGIRLP